MGSYNVQTASQGQMGGYGADINVPLMIASGTGGTIEMAIEGGILSNYSQVLSGNVRVLRVNGLQCSPGFFGFVRPLIQNITK